jgi:hypothetical protein
MSEEKECLFCGCHEKTESWMRYCKKHADFIRDVAEANDRIKIDEEEHKKEWSNLKKCQNGNNLLREHH